jgi:hypothetical protein
MVKKLEEDLFNDIIIVITLIVNFLVVMQVHDGMPDGYLVYYIFLKMNEQKKASHCSQKKVTHSFSATIACLPVNCLTL